MTDSQRKQILLLRSKGNGYGSISQKLDIPINTIKSFCRRNEEKVLSSPAPDFVVQNTARCENCGKEIIQFLGHKKKRFCCDKCRNTWWNSHLDLVKRKPAYDFTCPHCGKAFQIYGDKRRKFCSKDCFLAERFGEKNERE